MRRGFLLGIVLWLLLLTCVRLVRSQDATPVAGDFNRAHPLAQGLVAYLPILPHTAGGRTWWSPLERLHATLMNGAPWRSSAVTDWYGEVSLTAASSHYVHLGTAPAIDFPDQTFTVSLEFTRAASTGATAYFWAKRLADVPFSGGYFARTATDGAITARILEVGAGSAATITTPATSVLNGARHTLTVVYKTDTVTETNNDIQIYVDGVLQSGSLTHAGVGPYTPCSTCEFRLGTTSDVPSTTFQNMSVGRLMIWNRGLSAAEIARVARLTGPRSSGLFVPYTYDPGVVLNPRRNLSD